MTIGYVFKDYEILKMTQAKFFEYDEKEEYFEDEEEVRPPRRPGEAPDGAWGWMVVLGACICCAFVQGLIASSSVLSTDLGGYFNVGDDLKDIQVIVKTFCLCGGPLVCILTRKFSLRKVVMAGSVVVCASLLVSTQMPNPVVMRLSLGALAGLGLALVFQPSIVIIANWFENRRAFATGLATMGSGIGFFVFPQVYRHLLDTLDWKNATTILAALFLNTAVAGALYRPLTHAKPKGMKRGPIQHGAIMKALIAEKERQRTISNGSLDNCIITRDNRLIKIDKIDLRNKSNTYINKLKETFGFSSRSLNRSKNSLVVPKVVVTDPIYRPKSPRTSSNRLFAPKPSTSPPTPKRDSGCGSLEGSPTGRQVSRSYEALPVEDVNESWDRNLVVKLPPKDSPSKSDNNINLNNLDSKNTSPKRYLDDHNLDPTCLSNNVSPVGSVRSVNTRSPSLISQTSKNAEIYLPKHGSGMTITGVRSEMSTIDEEPEPTNCKVLRFLSKTLDLKLLKLPSFWLLIFTGSLTMIGETIPFVHLPAKALLLGSSENRANFLISYHWVLSIIGSVLFGWIADRPWASPIQLNNILVLLAGILSFFTSFYDNYNWLAFYASIFGFLTSAFFTLRSIMLIELFDKKNLVSSFSLLLFFHGIAGFIGYKLTDVLPDNGALYVSGSLLVVAGLFGMMFPKVKTWEIRRQNSFEVVHIEELTHETETYKIENCESTI
ncbi:hypothetical protein ACF0H5_012093 [Mactra antiquata]